MLHWFSIQVPNFGFIVFTDSESVERALAAKPILLYGSHRLNVEEKKMRAGGERGPHPATFGDRDQKDYGKRGSQVRNLLQVIREEDGAV